MTRPITRTLLVAAIAALTVTGTASAAQAEPTNCTLRGLGNGFQVSCTGGTGLVRVALECIAKNEFDSINYGPWVAVGGISAVRCGGARIVDSWYEFA
jgi:hypothetical protein